MTTSESYFLIGVLLLGFTVLLILGIDQFDSRKPFTFFTSVFIANLIIAGLPTLACILIKRSLS